MKKTSLLVALILIMAANIYAEYPPEGWTASIKEAITQAENEDKMILLNFTGSDWCSWCFKLDKEVFGTETFAQWSEENLVKVFVDFPRAIELDQETRKQNILLQQMLGVRGYPTIWLLGSDLTPLLRTGYVDGGADNYIRHLTEDQREVPAEDAQRFREEFRKALEEALGAIEG